MCILNTVHELSLNDVESVIFKKSVKLYSRISKQSSIARGKNPKQGHQVAIKDKLIRNLSSCSFIKFTKEIFNLYPSDFSVEHVCGRM
jgi:hypothetical protein